MIKLGDMVTGIPYVALNDSICGTIRKDDNIRIDRDGSLINVEAGGWLEMSQWVNDESITNVPVTTKIDTEAIERKIKMYQDMLEKIKNHQTSNNF